jgi:hypothetical protein
VLGAGENHTVAAFNSYVRDAMALDGDPAFHAFTFSVCEWSTTIVDPEMMVGAASVGSLPSCV